MVCRSSCGDLHRQPKDVARIRIAHNAVARRGAISAGDAQAQVDRGIAANAARLGVKSRVGLRYLVQGCQQRFDEKGRKTGLDTALEPCLSVRLEATCYTGEIYFYDARRLRQYLARRDRSRR